MLWYDQKSSKAWQTTAVIVLNAAVLPLCSNILLDSNLDTTRASVT